MRGLKPKLGFQNQTVQPFSIAGVPQVLDYWVATEGVSSLATVVSTWTGQKSGLVLTTTAGTPFTGTRTVNGVNVIDFNSSSRMAVTFPSTITQPIVIYALIVFDLITGSRVAYDGIDATNRAALATTSSLFYITSITNNLTNGATNSNPHLFRAEYNTPNSKFLIDTTEVTGATGAAGLAGLTIGGSYNGGSIFNGAFGGLIACNGIPSASNDTNIKAELNAIWGL